MKSYEEIAASVFQKRDEYRERQRRLRSTLTIVSSSVASVCLVLVISLSIFHALRAPSSEENQGFGGSTHSIGSVQLTDPIYSSPTNQSGSGETAEPETYGDSTVVIGSAEDVSSDGKGQSDETPGDSTTVADAPDTTVAEDAPVDDSPQKTRGHFSSAEDLIENMDMAVLGKIGQTTQVSEKLTACCLSVSRVIGGVHEEENLTMYIYSDFVPETDGEYLVLLRFSSSTGDYWPSGYYALGGEQGIFTLAENDIFVNSHEVQLTLDELQ